MRLDEQTLTETLLAAELDEADVLARFGALADDPASAERRTREDSSTADNADADVDADAVGGTD